MTGNINTQDSAEVVRRARRVTWVGFWWNAFLGVLKVVAGILAHSGALVADGIHSFSDFITDIIVIVSVGLARRKPDTKYSYGSGKYETFATMLIATALVIVGLLIVIEGADVIVRVIHGHVIDRPGVWALIACLVSIAVKEWLYRYTRRVGMAIGSQAVVANAWHHRSDALSSVATLAGIAGAYFLGDHWRVLDPVAQVIVGLFIIVVGVRMALPAINELLEVSLPEDISTAMENAIITTPGVLDYHHLRSRRNGPEVIIEVHIKVNPDITVREGHDIATHVENRLRDIVGRQSLITTHVEPYKYLPVVGTPR